MGLREIGDSGGKYDCGAPEEMAWGGGDGGTTTPKNLDQMSKHKKWRDWQKHFWGRQKAQGGSLGLCSFAWWSLTASMGQQRDDDHKHLLGQ